MIAYASRTGTRRNLAGLRAAGWRLMVSAKGVLRHEGFAYALDNGAWTAHVQGLPFDEAAFMKALDMLGEAADWIVLPDVVAGGLRSLEFSLAWAERLRHPRQMIAVQDGMSIEDVRPCLARMVGIFIGGSTEWKEQTMPIWGALAHEEGKLLHVGRVNTVRRMYLCAAAGATSFDGSRASRFAESLPLLDNAAKASDLFNIRRNP